MIFTAPEVQADFALDLLRAGGHANESLVLCPIVISSGLALRYYGAKGKTKKRIELLLSRENAVTNLKALDYSFLAANRLYFQKSATLPTLYIDTAKAAFPGQIRGANFQNATQTVEEINRWVSAKTGCHIKDFIGPEELNKKLQLLFLSAAYCRCCWTVHLERATVICRPFVSVNNQARKVDLLSGEGTFYYYEDRDIQVLGIPIDNRQKRLVIFLPREYDSLLTFLAIFDGQMLVEYMKRSVSSRVEIALPKINIQKETNLSNAFGKLGMRDNVKSEGDASCEVVGSGFQSSKLLHKAVFEVCGESEPLGADTTSINGRTGRRPVKFTVDHSFIFAVVENDAIHFIGKYI